MVDIFFDYPGVSDLSGSEIVPAPIHLQDKRMNILMESTRLQ